MDRVSTSWGAAPGQLLCATENSATGWLALLVEIRGKCVFPAPVPPLPGCESNSPTEQSLKLSRRKKKLPLGKGEEKLGWGTPYQRNVSNRTPKHQNPGLKVVWAFTAVVWR